MKKLYEIIITLSVIFLIFFAFAIVLEVENKKIIDYCKKNNITCFDNCSTPEIECLNNTFCLSCYT